MSLSIVIACINESESLAKTLESLYSTVNRDVVEVVVVDDASSTPLSVTLPPIEKTRGKIIQNKHRCGVGPSRAIGIREAKGDWILITDAHMRFKPGWFEHATDYFYSDGCAEKIWNAQCLGLDHKHMDVNAPVARYFGGTFNFFGPDRQNPKATQVFEGIWKPELQYDPYPLPCCMGACYFAHREWLIKLGGLQYLRSWGVDEQMLSLKSWLAGGEVLMAKKIEIGHIWRHRADRMPYEAPLSHLLYNKLFAMLTLLPDWASEKLIAKLPGGSDMTAAQAMIKADWHLVANERLYNASIFTRTFERFLQLNELNLGC